MVIDSQKYSQKATIVVKESMYEKENEKLKKHLEKQLKGLEGFREDVHWIMRK